MRPREPGLHSDLVAGTHRRVKKERGAESDLCSSFSGMLVHTVFTGREYCLLAPPLLNAKFLGHFIYYMLTYTN
ncbi:MAG: hypothetical protein PVF52_06135, partial [Granulosicoccaceae bacterium]